MIYSLQLCLILFINYIFIHCVLVVISPILWNIYYLTQALKDCAHIVQILVCFSVSVCFILEVSIFYDYIFFKFYSIFC